MHSKPSSRAGSLLLTVWEQTQSYLVLINLRFLVSNGRREGLSMVECLHLASFCLTKRHQSRARFLSWSEGVYGFVQLGLPWDRHIYMYVLTGVRALRWAPYRELQTEVSFSWWKNADYRLGIHFLWLIPYFKAGQPMLMMLLAVGYRRQYMFNASEVQLRR